MKVLDILKQKGNKVVTIHKGRTVYDAICTLVEEKIGSVLVVNEQGEVEGILTERDILRLAYSNLEEIRSLPIERVMTRHLFVASPADNVEDIKRLMTEKRIRHVPVFENGALAGIISIGDIVKHQLSDLSTENEMLKNYISDRYPA